MFKRLILASALIGGAVLAAPSSASAANFPPAPAIAGDAASPMIEKTQYWGPRRYYRPYRAYGWGPRPFYRPYRPYGWGPRPFYRPWGFYRPRPLYRPYYW